MVGAAFLVDTIFLGMYRGWLLDTGDGWKVAHNIGSANLDTSQAPASDAP
jgi:hypothetical protein